LTAERVERRLAAVLAADVAGYSRLMGGDEEGTLARLKAVRKALFDPAIASHRGRIVKTTGDGMLVEFASAVDAVRGAVEAQRAMAEQNASLPKHQRIEFRIGIHVGDIIFDENDIFGDGVNVAARVENECEPGGVYLSDDAFRQMRGKTSFVFEDIGERVLKNIEPPMRLYAVRSPANAQPEPPAGSGKASALPQSLPLPNKPSIVVLPFQNMSGDQEQEYFADGLTENLTTDLSRFPGIFVIGRNTAFTFKGKTIDLKLVGRELGVRYALEGSVQRGGDRIRVSVQLIDAQSGGHLWAERFDRERSDLFQVQDEISRRVAYSLTRQLNKAELERGQRERSSNPDSVDLVLRAKASELGGSHPDKQAAQLKLCEQAVQLDLRNADAWAGIATIKASAVVIGWSQTPSEDLRSAMTASEQALAINPHNPTAVSAKGRIFLAQKNFAAALEAFEHAIELNPSHPDYRQLAGVAKIFLGRAEEALESLNEAIRLSPRDLQIADYYMSMGMAYWELERYPEALDWLERSKAQNSRIEATKFLLASTYLRMGEQEKANAAVRDVLQTKADWTTKLVESSYPLRSASLAALVDDLRKAGLPDE
jgi:TolB-like protein/class 3 adenylate cyclase/thioredoxin-like negative regulator of GroEL